MFRLGDVSSTGQLDNFCWRTDLLQNKIRRLVRKTVEKMDNYYHLYRCSSVIPGWILYEFYSLFHYL